VVCRKRSWSLACFEDTWRNAAGASELAVGIERSPLTPQSAMLTGILRGIFWKT
jgi:hypothetical protein